MSGLGGVLISGVCLARSQHSDNSVPPPPPPPPQRHPKIVRVGTQVAADRLVYKREPEYPAKAKAKGIEGTVAFTAMISKTGTVQKVKIINGNPLLATAALNAVKHWRYKPFVVNGRRVVMVTEIDVHFVWLSPTKTGVY